MMRSKSLYMKRLSIVISDPAFAVLKEYQERHKIGTRDEAMDKLLLEFAKRRKA